MSGHVEDEAAERRLSAALAVAREQWPDRDALARVRNGVAAAVGSPLSANGSSQARLLRRSLRGSGWLRGAGTLVLMIGAGYAALRMQAGDATQHTIALAPQIVHAQAAVPAAPPQPGTLMAAVQQPAAQQPTAQEPTAAARIEPHRKLVHARPRVAAVPVAPAAPADPEAELALLRRALAALQHHPSESLELVAEHERDYAQGIFGQEREVIAIDALLALQRTSAAEARARAFLAQYPRSAHAPRIRALLGPDAANAANAAGAQAGAQVALEHDTR